MSLRIVLEFTRVDAPEDPHAFRFETQSYTSRGPGGGIARFKFPWTGDILANLEALRRPDRDPALVQQVGNLLQEALQPIGWEGIAERVRAATEDRRVFVTVRSNAAELYALPWELITLGASGQHLGELLGVVVRHEWPETSTTPESPWPRSEGGRVLLAWSAAGGAVPAAEHQRALATAWNEGHVGFDPTADILPHASAAALNETLTRAEKAGKPFAVLHLLCHGGRTGSTFGLVLHGKDGEATVVDAGRLRQLLAPFAKTLRLVVLAACDSGNIGDPGNHLGSVAQNLHRAGFQAVVASRYPLSVDGSIIVAESLYRSLLVDLQPLECAFTETRARLARLTEHLDWASLQLYAREADGDTRPIVFRPYRGLSAYEVNDRRFYFGFTRELELAVSRLRTLADKGRPRLLVISGASGRGKSSLVRCGVVAALDDHDHVVIVPGDDPLAALATARARRDSQTRPLLLIVDQFEELFNAPRDVRRRFARELWGLASAANGVSCVLVLQDAFIDACADLEVDDAGHRLDTIADNEEHRVQIRPRDPRSLREAIVRPAERVDLEFDPGLLDQIVGDIEGEPGYLPLMAYTLDLLWERREGRRLSAAAYQDLAGAEGALQEQAKKLVGVLSSAQLFEARKLLTRLVHRGEPGRPDTRQRVAVSELRPVDPGRHAAFDAVRRALSEARLIVSDVREVANGDGKEETLEVAHEALIRQWPQMQAWLDEEANAIAEIARVSGWVAAWRSHGIIPTRVQVVEMQAAIQRHGDDMTVEVREGVGAMGRALLRRIWFVRGLALAIPGMLLLTVAGVVIWGNERAQALNGGSDLARAQHFRANAALYAAASYKLHSLAAFRLRLVDELKYRKGLQDLLDQLPPPLHRLPWDLPANFVDIELSADGGLLAACWGAQGCRVYHNDTSSDWDHARLVVLREVPQCTFSYGRHVGFDHDGKHLYCGSDSLVLYRVNISTGKSSVVAHNGVAKLMGSPRGDFLAAKFATLLAIPAGQTVERLYESQIRPGALDCHIGGDVPRFWTDDGMLVGNCTQGFTVYHDPSRRTSELITAPGVALLEVSRDGEFVVTLGDDSIDIHRKTAGRFEHHRSYGLDDQRFGSARHAALNRDATLLALVRQDFLTLIEVDTGRVIERYVIGAGFVPRFVDGDKWLLLLPSDIPSYNRSTALAVRTPTIEPRLVSSASARRAMRFSVLDDRLRVNEEIVADLAAELSIPNRCDRLYSHANVREDRVHPDGEFVLTAFKGDGSSEECRRSVTVLLSQVAEGWHAERIAQCGIASSLVDLGPENEYLLACEDVGLQPRRFYFLDGARIVRTIDEAHTADWARDWERRALAVLRQRPGDTRFEVVLHAWGPEGTRRAPELILAAEAPPPCPQGVTNMAIRGERVAVGCKEGVGVWDRTLDRWLLVVETASEGSHDFSLSKTGEHLVRGEARWDLRTLRRLDQRDTPLHLEGRSAHVADPAQPSIDDIIAHIESTYLVTLDGARLRSSAD